MRPFPATLGLRGPRAQDVFEEFRGAFQAWQAVAALRFEEVPDIADADLILGVQSTPKGVAYADVVQEVLPDTRLNPIRAAAICLNPSVPWEKSFDGNQSTYDLKYVALHEIGHVIGLDHSWGARHSIMNFRYRERVRALQPADIAGARALYGRPVVEPQLAQQIAAQRHDRGDPRP